MSTNFIIPTELLMSKHFFSLRGFSYFFCFFEIPKNFEGPLSISMYLDKSVLPWHGWRRVTLQNVVFVSSEMILTLQMKCTIYTRLLYSSDFRCSDIKTESVAKKLNILVRQIYNCLLLVELYLYDHSRTHITQLAEKTNSSKGLGTILA